MSQKCVSAVWSRWNCARRCLMTRQFATTSCCGAVANDRLNSISKRRSIPSSLRFNSVPLRQFGTEVISPTKGQRTLRANRDVGASDIRSLMQKFRGSKIIAAPEIEQLMEMIRKVPTFTLSATDGSFIIWCCEKLMPRVSGDQKVKVAEEVVNLLMRAGRADISHFNQLLTVYLDNNIEFVTTDFLMRLNEAKIEPNRVTYTRLLTRLGNMGDLSALRILLDRMEQLKMAKSEATYTPLIHCLIKQHQFDQADAAIQEMRSQGIDTTDVTLGTMVTAFASLGELEKLKETLETAATKNVRINTRDYLVAASSLYEDGHTVEAIELLNESPRKLDRDYKKICAEHIGHLCSLGKFDLAYEILLSTSGSAQSSEMLSEDPVILFLTGLVENNALPDMVVRFAREIYDRKLNHAAEQYLKRHSNHGSLRHAMFLPLLVHQIKGNKLQEFTKTLEWMNEFHLFAEYDCFKNLFFPHLTIPFPKFITVMQDNIAYLKRYNKTCLVSSYIGHCIANRRLVEMRSALSMLLGVPINIEYLTRSVAQMFYGSHRFQSYAYPMDYMTELLRTFQSFMFTSKSKTYRTDPGKSLPDGVALNNEIIRVIMEEADTNDERVIEALLKDLCAKDIVITPAVTSLIQTTCKTKFSPRIAQVCSELVNLNSSRVFPPASEEVFQTETDKTPSNDKSTNSSGTIYQLFQACETSDKPEQVEALLSECQRHPRFRLEGSLVASLILFYTRIMDVEKALEWFDKAIKDGIILNPKRYMQLATLLLKKEQTDRAISVLNSCTFNQKYRVGDENSPALVSVNLLLREAMQHHNPEIFEKILAILESRGLDPALLERFCRSGINFCLQHNDLPGALDHFNRCAEKYGGTKGARELMMAFIRREDNDSLEKLFDRVCATHGKAKGFADLAVCLIQTKKLPQAEKIFTDRTIEVDSGSLMLAVRRLASNGRIEELQDLLKVSKNCPNLKRSFLYETFVQACRSKNAWQAALDAWTDMQEENVVATTKTLKMLESLLLDNRQKVPFSVGQGGGREDRRSEESQQSVGDANTTKETASLSASLNEGNVDRAIKVIIESDGSSLLYGNLINFLVAQKRLSDAVNLLILSFQRGKLPSVMVIKSLLEQLANAGDFATIEKVKMSIAPRMAELYEVKEFVDIAKINGSSYQEVVDTIIRKPDSSVPQKVLVALALKRPECIESVLDKFLATTSISGQTNLANLWKHLTVHNPKLAYDVLERDPDIDSRAGSSFLLKLFGTLNDEKGVRQRLSTSSDPKLSAVYYSHLIFLKLLKNSIAGAVAIHREAQLQGIDEDLLKRSVLLRLTNSTRKSSQQAVEADLLSEDPTDSASRLS